MAQATKRNQVCDLYIGYCTLKYINIQVTFVHHCNGVFQSKDSKVSWLEREVQLSLMPFWCSPARPEENLPPVPYGISISLQCIDTTISEAEKIKASIIDILLK